MKFVIDIPENVIEGAKSSPNYYPAYHFEKIWRAIANGTPYEERPTGEWGEPFEHGNKTYHKCSCCHISSELILIDNFCPNCGAKMKGGEV